MKENVSDQVIQRLENQLESLTPKGRVLGKFIIGAPRKAVFMTSRELAENCGVSEATVVRFVARLGYAGYSAFLQALREYVDTSMTLPDRVDMPQAAADGTTLLHRVIVDEINNLQKLYEVIDHRSLESIVMELRKDSPVYVIGSRLSYTFAYYLGWSLTKIRKDVQILKGSDSTTIDRLTGAHENSLVVIISTSRYPNELIRLAKLSRRLEQRLLVLTDSNLCPLLPFAQLSLVIPSKSIPILGHPSSITCIINGIVLSLTDRRDKLVREHQQKMERIYLENDVLFNPHPYEP